MMEKVSCRYNRERRQRQQYLRVQSERDHSDLGHVRGVGRRVGRGGTDQEGQPETRDWPKDWHSQTS